MRPLCTSRQPTVARATTRWWRRWLPRPSECRTPCVRVVVSDTATSRDAGSAGASRLTYMTGNAVCCAAEKALASWRNEDRPSIGEATYLAPKTTRLDPENGQGHPNFAYGYVAEAAQVAVDTETGQVRVERFVCRRRCGGGPSIHSS